ncbi:MAG: sigma-70 family RNA polymerase sigma factor [Lachnospiraceae bacterium]
MKKRNLEEIYQENMSAVYKYLFCLTHNPDLAEELTQETFYQAAKGIDRFRGDCKVSVWLCQIAKHLWYGELRKRRQELLPLEEAGELDSNFNLEERYLQSLDKLTLFKKLHELDSSAKEVVYLRLTGELSFAEIGEIMGKTENWARVTFYRGKQKIVKGWDQNE